jgi:hypothetical protein
MSQLSTTCIVLRFVIIAHNEQGFVQAGHCCLFSPELKPNKEIKAQVNKQDPSPYNIVVMQPKHNRDKMFIVPIRKN